MEEQFFTNVVCESDKVKKAIKWIVDGIALYKRTKQELKIDDQLVILDSEHEIYWRHYGEKATVMTTINNLFSPWSDKVKAMNCRYFDYLHGIELLVSFHAAVREIGDVGCRCMIDPDGTEEIICFILGVIAQDSSYRKRVTECGGLECCIHTILKDLRDEKAMANILQATCNIADTPKNGYYISQHGDFMDFILPMFTVETYLYGESLAFITVTLLLNLAQSKEAHVNLLKSDTTDSIIGNLMFESAFLEDNLSMKMLKFYGGVFLSEMILRSAHLLQTFPQSSLLKIESLLNIVCKYNIADILEYELHMGNPREAFEFLKCLYEPDEDCGSSQFSNIITQLCKLSVDVLLISLQSTLARMKHIKVVMAQNIEHIVILPWSVPLRSCDRAKDVVLELAKVCAIQPPSLSLLVKGKLAKTSFGLKKIDISP